MVWSFWRYCLKFNRLCHVVRLVCILIITQGSLFKVKFNLDGVDDLCDRLRKQMKKVKGARAGYYKNISYPDGLTLIENALIQEFGTEHIPPRPFLRKALKKNPEWAKFVKELFDANGDGHLTLEQIAAQVGLMMKDAIQEAISSNIPPPNAPSTIRQKGSSKTLIDTGTLRNSVQSMVIKE